MCQGMLCTLGAGWTASMDLLIVGLLSFVGATMFALL
jgi:hypothetical protein